jgi:hypothetical protein
MSPRIWRALNITNWCVIALILGVWAYSSHQKPATDRLAATVFAMGLLAAVACLYAGLGAVLTLLYPPRPLLSTHKPRKWEQFTVFAAMAIVTGTVSLYLLVPAVRLLVDRLFAW